MIVCICRGVRCSEIRAAVRAGAETVEAVGEACEAGTDCGSCQFVVQDLIDEEREGAGPGVRAAGRVHLPTLGQSAA